tara:strand:- start:11 stop:493 length:483 start_codon:yes stop_codon:yes gene_type:complete
MSTEKLKFKLELFSTHWLNKPGVDVQLNGKSQWKGEIGNDIKDPQVIEFEHECEEGDKVELTLHRYGKTTKDSIVNEKGDLLKDQLLHIKSIEIDEIDLGALVYEGVYTPEYPEPWATQQKDEGIELKKSFTNVTQMGFNGTWTFSFESPFYMWLLDNLY